MYNKQTYLLFLILSIVQNKECEINHLDSFFIYITTFTSVGGGGSSTLSVTPIVRPPC